MSFVRSRASPRKTKKDNKGKKNVKDNKGKKNVDV
jgi:hypothetical protein